MRSLSRFLVYGLLLAMIPTALWVGLGPHGVRCYALGMAITIAAYVFTAPPKGVCPRCGLEW